MSTVYPISYYRQRFLSGGIQTIPLKPRSKLSGDSWLSTPPSELWRLAPEYSNLAVPMGQPLRRGRLAALDGDSPQTARNLENYLKSIGIDPAKVPQVSTPTKSGRHFYLATNAPDWYTWGHLAPDMGAGELRANHCYLVAPASVLEVGLYQFVNGDPGALESAPFIEWRDLVPLLKTTDHAPQVIPPRLVKREPAPLVFQIFRNLPEARKGDPVPFDDTENGPCYPSRSEAEFAICILLILAGWEFDDVYQEFKRRAVGKFTDKGQGRKYLLKTYERALSALAANETRREISQALEAVKAQPWPGRAGLYDRKTLEGILAIAWQFANEEIKASARDLAIHAGISWQAANKAIKRLVHAKYITKKPAATRREIHNLRARIDIIHNIGHGETPEKPTASPLPHALAELFTAGNYGITAGAVVDCLLSGQALTVATLAANTGKHAGTIRRVIKALAKDGIITQDGQEKTAGRMSPCWRLAPDKLTAWAEKWETGAQLERRRERVARERETWQNYQARRKMTKREPATMPPNAPKTGKDARNPSTWAILPYVPQDTPFWALPGNEASWLYLLAGVWERDKERQPYQVDEEYFRHDTKIQEFTPAELAEIDAHPWPEYPPF